MNFIDIFKTKIAESRKLNNDVDFLNDNFLNNFYDSIKDGVIQFGVFLGLQKVDDITLRNYFETSVKEYLSVYPIDPGISHSLTKEGFKTWLDDEREEDINWDYSNRYFEHLLKSGRS
jgi:hypothetical protein